MPKDIRFIPLDNTLTDWLLEKLEKEPPMSDSAAELRSGLLEMKSGKLHSLFLGTVQEPLPAAPETPGEIRAGQLQIFLKSHRVLVDGKDISLTPKEFDILYFLAENRGTVFTKEQIYQAVWSDKYLLDDSNIMAFIRKLRKKIEPNPDDPQYILTIWGIGYKFNDTL